MNEKMIGETIADMVEDHFLVCDKTGSILFANKVMQNYLGYTKNELENMKFYQILADCYKSKGKELLDTASAVVSQREDFLLRGKDKNVILHLKAVKKEDLIFIYGNEKEIELERIRKKLDIEIENALKIHRRFLPETLPNNEKISFASLYIPAEEIGGDIFDAFKVDHGLLNDYFEQYVCFICDVSGHGLDSAMLGIFLKDTIRSYFRLKHIPGQILSPKDIMNFVVEQYLKEGYPEEYLVCLFIVVLDLKTNELAYCNAGMHIPPLLVDDKNHIIELNNGGVPISTALPEFLLKYDETVIPLSPKTTLFIMSDGLPEQQCENERYQKRLNRLIPDIHHLSAERIVQEIYNDFTDYLKHEKIRDDITLVAVKIA